MKHIDRYKRISKWVSKDPTRPYLGGVYKRPLGLMATDGHRMLIDSSLTYEGKAFNACVYLKTEEFLEIPEGKIPPFESLIPDNKETYISWTIPEWIPKVAKARKPAPIFIYKSGHVTLTQLDMHEHVITGEGIEIQACKPVVSLDARLLDGLEGLDVVIYYTTNSAPVKIIKDELTAVIMPLRM